jgi:hypothetical protein
MADWINKEHQYKHNRIICYLDLLGFRSKISQLSIDAKGILYNNLIDKFQSSCEENLATMDGHIYARKQRTHIAWFSDTVILYSKPFDVNKPNYKMIEDLLYSTKKLFQTLLKGGFPSRGAISVGQFYVDEKLRIYVGNTLVDAYEFAENLEIASICLTCNIREYFERHNIENNLFGRYFVSYHIPMKSRNQVDRNETKVLDWIRTIHGNTVRKEKLKVYFSKNSELTDGARRKLRNTEEFYDYIVGLKS